MTPGNSQTWVMESKNSIEHLNNLSSTQGLACHTFSLIL